MKSARRPLHHGRCARMSPIRLSIAPSAFARANAFSRPPFAVRALLERQTLDVGEHQLRYRNEDICLVVVDRTLQKIAAGVALGAAPMVSDLVQVSADPGDQRLDSRLLRAVDIEEADPRFLELWRRVQLFEQSETALQCGVRFAAT